MNYQTKIETYIKKLPSIKGSKAYLPASLFLFLAFIVFFQRPKQAVVVAGSGPEKILGAFVDLRGPSEPKSPIKFASAVNTLFFEKISAKSFLVYDSASGQAIFSKNSDMQLPIASLTKLMTGLLAYNNLDFNSKILTGPQQNSVSPSVNFIKNDQVKVADIFNAMIVGSCNDAAQMLASEVASKTNRSIADLMNEQAKALNMGNTKFSNPTGFDLGENYSTASDLQKLVNETQKFSVFSNLGLTQNLVFSGSLGTKYQIKSTNKLLGKTENLYAIKTGFTAKSLGSMVTKILANGREVIIIVLGSQNREGDTLILKDAASAIIWQ